MLSLDMFGTKLRLAEILRTGKDKDYYRDVEVTVSVLGIIMSRYYLSPQLYPHEKLPTFLSGTAYIFSGSLLSLLYSCALR